MEKVKTPKSKTRLYKEELVDRILNDGKLITEDTFCCPGSFEFYTITRNIAVNIAENLIKFINPEYKSSISETEDISKLSKKTYKSFLEQSSKALHKKIEVLKEGNSTPTKKKRVPLDEAIFKAVSRTALNIALLGEAVKSSSSIHKTLGPEFKILENEYKKLIKNLSDMVHEARFELD